MTALPIPLRLALMVLVMAAGAYDLRSRRIPNWLNLSGIVLGFALQTFLFGKAGFLASASGLGVALLVYLPLYALRGMGAGDVKLMAAVGSLSGPVNWLSIFLLTSVLGGVAALCAVAVQKRLGQTWFNVQELLVSLMRFRAPHKQNSALDVRSGHSLRLPHGAVIAGGTALFSAIGLIAR